MAGPRGACPGDGRTREPPTFVRMVIRNRGGTFTKRRTIVRRAGFGVGPAALAFDGRGRIVVAFGALNKRPRTGASLLARQEIFSGSADLLRLSRARLVAPPAGSILLLERSGPDVVGVDSHRTRTCPDAPGHEPHF